MKHFSQMKYLESQNEVQLKANKMSKENIITFRPEREKEICFIEK